MSVIQHYEQYLADHYTWMFGLPFEDMVQEQTKLLEGLDLNDLSMVVDLGCGSGFQACALQALGAKKVHAFDFSAKLLNELNERKSGNIITTYQTDIQVFSDYFLGKADTVVCMGDTLTHLPSYKNVDDLFMKVANKLEPGGTFVLAWRDLSGLPLNEEVVIDVHSDHERTLRCSLVNLGAFVRVTDSLHFQASDDREPRTSSYQKLKLPKQLIVNSLVKHGFQIKEEQHHRGMIVLKATSSPPTDGRSK